MIPQIEKKTVYVYSLTGIATGGCELLHQLVGYLNDHGRDAFIVYEGAGLKGDRLQIPAPYRCYHVRVADKVPDDENVLVVLDEGFLYLASQFKRATCFFWWLSVDNFFIDPIQMPFVSWKDMKELGKDHLWKCIRSRIHYLKARLLKKDKKEVPWYPVFSLKTISQRACLCGYQSEYARLFLQKHGFKNLIPLSDYINTDFVCSQDSLVDKEDIVIYNPKKGFEYTQKLIDTDSTIKWIPLINLSRLEMRQTMHRAKIYVDFGYHPGKDRIPREAALCNCCVITGKRGAAANPIDIHIPEDYKFDELATPIDEILNKLHYVFVNYKECLQDQIEYKKRIMEEKSRFFGEINMIFGI